MKAKYKIIKCSDGIFYVQHRLWFMWWSVDHSCTFDGAKEIILKAEIKPVVVYKT